MIEDYEQKIKDEIQAKDDDIEIMQDEWYNKERDFTDQINQLQQDNKLMHQQLQNQDSYMMEMKESLSKVQSNSQYTLEKQLENFNEERKDLTNKIEKQAFDLTKKEREITTLENQKETLLSQM